MSAMSWRRKSSTPSGPCDHGVGEVDEGALLLGARAHQQRRHAVGAAAPDRLEGVDVAEVVADEDERPGPLLLGQGLHRGALVHPR